MDSRTENRTIIILYALLAATLVFVVLQNFEDPWAIILLSGILIVSITVRNAIIYSSPKYRRLGRLNFIFDIIIIFIISRLDKGGSSQIYYLVLIGDASIAYSYTFGAGITFLSFLAFSLERYISREYLTISDFASGMIFSSLAFIVTYAVMYIAKFEIRQREKLSQTMYELKVKTKLLENAYVKLKDTSKELEEMTILKERNTIAREIHDTVGHTLTTVLLEMEAGERLIKIDPDLAANKIRLAKGQVRKGLSDIRESVRTLKEGREIIEFVPSIHLLIDEITKHGDIFIKYEISELPRLTVQQEKALYRALQEGLTNGIKHGKSTAFVFKLKYENGQVEFFLQDNGEGTDKIVHGFGLTSMEQRVREAGGVLDIHSCPGEGCSINISIPAGDSLSVRKDVIPQSQGD